MASDPSKAHQWADAIQRRIAKGVEIYGRLALPFFGGLENCLLLHLARPWKDKITILTMNTGATFPHVERFIEQTLTGWNRRSIKTDVSHYLANVALPSQIFPLIDLLRSPLDFNGFRLAQSHPWSNRERKRLDR
jgi:3'-phosphoadenosine 5'-phosphosulfate sulfotransferase (PAPS reductase)/FAD synthetase